MLATLFVAQARAAQVVRAIDGDAVEPGAEVGARLEASQVAVGAQERFLHHFLRVVFVARHTKRQPENGGAVPLDKRAKRVAVAGHSLGHYGGIGTFHPHS